MKYLLDTHALLWRLFEINQLSDNVRDIIRYLIFICPNFRI